MCCLPDMHFSERFVFCAGDDFVLQGFAEVAEVVAVAGDTDDEVAVLLRVGLGFAQCLGADDVELDVVAVEPEVGSHQARQVVDALLALE